MTFYTYMWLREDGTPYYVGKGHGHRAFRKGCPFKERIIVQEWPSEADAFKGEQLLIALYGRKDLGTGILRNRTDGGEGPAGLVFTKEYRQKLRAAKLGKKLPPWSEESCLRRSQTLLGHEVTLVTRQKLRESHEGRKLSTAHCDSMSRVRLGKKLSSETCRRMSESQKLRHKNIKHNHLSIPAPRSSDGSGPVPKPGDSNPTVSNTPDGTVLPRKPKRKAMSGGNK